MPRKPFFQRLELPAGGLTRLADPCGTRIECRSGTLWVTVDGDLRDVVLEPGESHLLATPSPVIVQAIVGTASLVLRSAAPARPCVPTLAQRTRRLLQRWLPGTVAGAM